MCLIVFCLYFIILYNTKGMSHLKGKLAIEIKVTVIFLRTKTPDTTGQFSVTHKRVLHDLCSGCEGGNIGGNKRIIPGFFGGGGNFTRNFRKETQLMRVLYKGLHIFVVCFTGIFFLANYHLRRSMLFNLRKYELVCHQRRGFWYLTFRTCHFLLSFSYT